LSRRIRNFIDNSSPIQEKLWLSSSLVPAEGSSLTINPYLDPVFREYLAIDHGPYIRNLDNFFEQREKMASWRWMQLATPGHPIRVQCFQVDIGGPYGVPGFKLRGVWEHEWENGVSLEEFYEALPRVKNARMAWEIRCDANTAWVEEITRRWALWLDEWKLEVNLELLLQSTGLICCDYDLRVWMVSGFGI
jgi:hypothetical protein